MIKQRDTFPIKSFQKYSISAFLPWPVDIPISIYVTIRECFCYHIPRSPPTHWHSRTQRWQFIYIAEARNIKGGRRTQEGLNKQIDDLLHEIISTIPNDGKKKKKSNQHSSLPMTVRSLRYFWLPHRKNSS